MIRKAGIIIGGLEVLFVLAFTLACGLVGSSVGLMGFLIGAFAGFCISAFLVSISMNLTEIAKNTQRTRELLEQSKGKPPSRRKRESDERLLSEEEKEDVRRLLERRGVRIRDD